MRQFTLPGNMSQIPIDFLFAKYFNNHKEYFTDNTTIQSFFGCPYSCIWNGGSAFFGETITNKDLRYILEKLNDIDVNYRFTFTNKLLKEEHLLDTYGNAILKVSSDFDNVEALVANDLMENHLKKNNPNMEIIQSVTRCWFDLDVINEKSKDQKVVLPIRFNREYDAINQLEHKENIEILLNEICIDKCPYNESHYISYNKYTLRETDTFFDCPFQDKRGKHVSHYIHTEEIQKYEDMGFSLFKLEGRGHDDNKLMFLYCDYLVKPEYQYKVLKDIIKSTRNYNFWAQ